MKPPLQHQGPAPPTPGSSSKSKPYSKSEPKSMEDPTRRVTSKLEEGDYRGSGRPALMTPWLIRCNATYIALQQKHPFQHLDSSIPPTTAQSNCFKVSEDEIINAIKAFPAGCAGGPDGLQPQHLKDMIGPAAESSRQILLPALMCFTELVLNGNTPASIRPYFFGATLIALEKKGAEGNSTDSSRWHSPLLGS